MQNKFKNAIISHDYFLEKDIKLGFVFITDTCIITVYIHNDSFPIKSAFLPPFRIRKRNLSELSSDNMHFKLIDMKTKGKYDFSEQFTEHFNHHSNSKQLEKDQLTYLLDEICDSVNGEVSVSYINHFNVQNMRQTIKLTPLFCNLIPSLLFIRNLSIQFFSKFPKNW